MENKINVAELLKDCPKGMELDCLLCNSPIALEGVAVNESKYPIKAVCKDGFIHVLTKYGTLYNHDDAKCVIFPKGKTTWEGFVPPCQFKIEKGKWYVCTKDLLDNYANKAFRKGDTYLSTQDGSLIPSNSNVPFEVVCCASTYFRNWTINDAKDGDVLAINWHESDDSWEKIIIFKKYHNNGVEGLINSPCVEGYGNTFKNGKLVFHEEVPYFSKTWTASLHPATKEQRNLLFQKIKEAGYKWNPETKDLEELIEPKFKVGDRIKKGEKIATIVRIDENFYDVRFDNGIGLFTISLQDEWELVPNKFDISTLIPFESRVLARDNNIGKWKSNFWGFYDSDRARNYPYECCGNTFAQCIPYNDDTKHLLGKTDDCDDFYKTWE